MADSFALREVRVSQSPLERFEEYLRSRGKRITRPRRIIVEEVFRRHEHFDAEELLDHLRRRGKDAASRPTVYRTLGELIEAGLLREITTPGRRAVYEHDYGYPQHDHLHCQKCNKLIEFHSDEVKRIREAVARQYHFRVTGHQLIINGICADCAQSQRRMTRRLDLI